MVNTKVKVNVPGRSGFDKSFKHILTTKVGTITPIVNKLVIPGAKGSMKIAISAALPPLASDTFMRCNLKVEAFLTPIRLLYGGFEGFLTGKNSYDFTYSGYVQPTLPKVYAPVATTHPDYAPGTLADYLGAGAAHTTPSTSKAYFNMLPFLCYHRVYDDWYRNAKIQNPVFCNPVNLDESAPGTLPLSALPYLSTTRNLEYLLSDSFVDGVQLGALRQRNWDDDYFTIATTSPQAGTAQSVSTTGNTFTISALRAANSLQQYLERSNLASPRMQDFVKAHYGASLNSGVAQRAILLGSASYPVYSKGVYGTGTSTPTNNPFSSIGAQYGSGFASGTDFVCTFEANEPCILMVMATLVPEANYSSGIDHFMRLFVDPGSQVDMPDPLLENVGNEPIYNTELNGQLATSLGTIFGYVPRNTWYKSSRNKVSGLLRAGQSLSSFVASRDLNNITPLTISSSFLQIPTNALDNVTAVTSDISTYGCWIDSFIDLKMSEPLVESAMPSLQDPAYEHGHGVSLNINGDRL